jgi:hypothetical protein
MYAAPFREHEKLKRNGDHIEGMDLICFKELAWFKRVVEQGEYLQIINAFAFTQHCN